MLLNASLSTTFNVTLLQISETTFAFGLDGILKENGNIMCNLMTDQGSFIIGLMLNLQT